MALLVTVASVSCQKLNEVFVGKGNYVFSIQAPGVLTRANEIGDGQNVNIVYYEIYKADTKHKNSIIDGTPLIKGSTKVDGKTASLKLNLLQDQKYVALFWAQVDGHANEYYTVNDLRAVKVSYTKANGKNALANDEDRAAFCQRFDFSTGDNDPRDLKVYLERPFAQINLGTTLQSLNIDYKVNLEESKMKLAGAGTLFNVAKMQASADFTQVDFDFAAVPQQLLEVGKDNYAYAGMNYILVPSNKGNVKLTYDIKTDVGTVNRTIAEVPVEKNFRTNLLGNLLTQETKIEIVVDERFDGFHNIEVNN